MSTLQSLRDVLLHELSDLHSAETQIIDALPKLAEAANSPKLAKAFNDHLLQTRAHLTRLEQVFKALGEKPSGEVCTGMKGLLAEGAKLLKAKSKAEPEAFDAALIAAAQRVEHYEMAGYGCARTFCKTLGETKCQLILQTTLDEEGAADKLLTLIAEGGVNEVAAMGAAQA